MSSPRSHRRPAGRGRWWSALLALPVVAAATGVHGWASAQPAPQWQAAASTYIVTLKQPPAASYAGGVDGIPATRPTAGGRLDPRSTAVRKYRAHLTDRQDDVAEAVGADPSARFSVALNGFAARLTVEQATEVAARKDVASVVPDRILRGSTNETPKLLGLTGSGGTWAKVGGQANAGRGVVVGVIDTGVWPENPALKGAPVTRTTAGGTGVPYRDSTKRIVVPKADGGVFTGDCQAGEKFAGTECNSKVVSARWFGKGWIAAMGGEDKVYGPEYLSPRDENSHGTHTGTTAVGNPVNDVSVHGQKVGDLSGMAPAAKLAVYKALWTVNDMSNGSAGSASDIVAAIDQAVTDGVDVINASLGRGGGSAFNPLEQAFLNAAAAGVFVAGAAGNAGDDGDDGNGANSTDHNVPWVTTVGAAEVKNRDLTVTLGNGTKLWAAGMNTTKLPATPAIHAEDATAPEDYYDHYNCRPETLNPAKVKGKVVVCNGSSARAASAEVARAGGVGIVSIANGERDADGGAPEAVLGRVPTAVVAQSSGETIAKYLTTAKPTIAITPGDSTGKPTPLPRIAMFSSRGPALGVGGDIVKPDIAAPGVGIIAGANPDRENGHWREWHGTSMATPHIAGLGALILGHRPSWSPARIRSAMMTTARDTANVKDGQGNPSRHPFAQGAGLVDPKRFLDPGLVYDAGITDWQGWLAGIGVKTDAKAVDPSNVNQPSIAVGSLFTTQTVTRRVTALTAGTYKATATLPGHTVTAKPSTLTLKAGETRTFTVTITRTTAKLDTFTPGNLTWTGAGKTVRIPVAVRPILVDPPAEVTAKATTGFTTWPVTLGTTTVGPLTLQGLTAGDKHTGTLTPGPITNPPKADKANLLVPVTVTENTDRLRIDLTGATTDDLDLYLGQEEGGDSWSKVAESARAGAAERLDLKLEPGTYTIHVHAFASPNPTAPYTLRVFNVPKKAASNATVTPTTLIGTPGKTAKVTLTWKGLTPGKPYLGYLTYGSSPRHTTITID